MTCTNLSCYTCFLVKSIFHLSVMSNELMQLLIHLFETIMNICMNSYCFDCFNLTSVWIDPWDQSWEEEFTMFYSLLQKLCLGIATLRVAFVKWSSFQVTILTGSVCKEAPLPATQDLLLPTRVVITCTLKLAALVCPMMKPCEWAGFISVIGTPL